MRTSVNGGRMLLALGLALALVSCATAKEGKKDPAPKKTKTTAAMKKATPVKEADPGSQLGAQAPSSVKEVLDKIERVQTDVKNVQMDLRMEVKDHVSGQKQSTRGKVVMKNPGKAFVHYLKPTEQFLYIDGKDMQMYLPDQGTVYKQEADRSQPTYIGVGKQLKRYSATSQVSIIKDSDKEVVLLFIPENADATFERMKVTIQKKLWWPSRVEIETASMKTVAEFLKPVFDQVIDDSVFKFEVPPGANVVEWGGF